MDKNLKKHKNKKQLAPRKRTISRLMAIQIFYQFEFYLENKPLEAIIDDVVDNYTIDSDQPTSSYRDKVDLDFLKNLLTAANISVDQVDLDIEKYLKDGWNLEKLPDIILYILRFGAIELKFMHDTPLKVVVDEYVDIAAGFFENKKITFVNGILENLAKEYRAQEFAEIQKLKKPKND